MFEVKTGKTADADFGAWVIQPVSGSLMIGLGNNPCDSNGALVVSSSDGINLVAEHVLDEQGITDFQVLQDGRMLVAGVDPYDAWSLGNLYWRSADGIWTKQRTQPNTVHTFGMWYSSPDLWVCGGMHTGDGLTTKGRVLHSADAGATWDKQVDVNDFRLYDVIGHAGRLYATGLDSDRVEYLYASCDSGMTWSTVLNSTPRSRSRMIEFKQKLLVFGVHQDLHCIDESHAVASLDLPFIILADCYNSATTDGEFVYAIAYDGTIWRSSDLISWSCYTYVPNVLALCWWPGMGLMISDRGLSARVWVA
jgi:hypothetical protein